ncbi:hypothetical protein L2E82_44770 [Cichorium intybus]|uniref:Uncharacterized protein n=1 Tax=Cichorium intybus TaxID=13427 RepID=A0ACB8ZS47_CICIN|nr:hypothetical protein L2E82_44770 [Cichorium intybus]
MGIPGEPELHAPAEITIRGVPTILRSKLNQFDTRLVIPLGHDDPSAFPCFRTSPIAEDAIIDTLRSSKFNGYSSTIGIPPARKYSLFFLVLLLLTQHESWCEADVNWDLLKIFGISRDVYPTAFDLWKCKHKWPDVYMALAGAVGALYDPLHGGANKAVLKMINEIGTVNNIPEFIEGVKKSSTKTPNLQLSPDFYVIRPPNLRRVVRTSNTSCSNHPSAPFICNSQDLIPHARLPHPP